MGLSLVLAPAALAAFPGENGKIAFVDADIEDGGADTEIFTINRDGTGLDQLTHNAAFDAAPAWSADGEKIAFSSDGVISVINANGSGETSIGVSGFQPAWSPDGTKIVFETPFTSIATVNADGSAEHPIVEMEGAVPAWSPDGQTIAFSGCCFAPVDSDSSFHILVTSAAGSGTASIADGDGPILPNWSPDGNEIAFQSDNGTEVMSPNGAARTVVGACVHPAFSPEGDEIVCKASPGGLEIRNADGSGSPAPLTATGSDPDWQPIPQCSAQSAQPAEPSAAGAHACNRPVIDRVQRATACGESRRGAPRTSGGRPRITAIDPGAAISGAAVLARGRGLTAKGLKAAIGGKRAKVSRASRSSVRIAVPKLHPGRYRVVVRRGKQSSSAPLRVLKPFNGDVGARLDRSHAATATIGPDGGELAAKGADKTSYRLAVPAGALAGEQSITLIPVKRFTGLPLSGPDEAGVRLLPDGLALHAPATLTITGAGKFGASTIGFGTGVEGFEASEPLGHGRSVQISIDHFSDHGASEAAEADIANVLNPILDQPGNLSLAAINHLLGLLVIWDKRFSESLDANHVPPRFCVRQPICNRVIDKAIRSVDALVVDACTRGRDNPTFSSIFVLNDLAGNQTGLGAEPGALDCVAEEIRAIAVLALDALDADPLATFRAKEPPADVDSDLNGDDRLSAFEFTAAITDTASTFDSSLAVPLSNGLADALERILRDGSAGCETGQPGAAGNLREGFAYAQFLRSLVTEYLNALDRCGVSVVVSPPGATLDTGAQRQFQATLTAPDRDPGVDDFSWSASGGAITQEGLYTAPDSEGVFTVRATSTRFPDRSGTALVTVAAGCGG